MADRIAGITAAGLPFVAADDGTVDGYGYLAPTGHGRRSGTRPRARSTSQPRRAATGLDDDPRTGWRGRRAGLREIVAVIAVTDDRPRSRCTAPVASSRSACSQGRLQARPWLDTC